MPNPFTRGIRSFGTVLLGGATPKEDRQPIEIDTYYMDIDHYNKTGEIRKLEQTIEPNEPELQNTDHIAQPNKMVETEETEMTPKKICKPTAEELRADQLVMNKAQAMKKYNCARATIERWTREYGLPHWRQTWQRDTEKQNEAVLPSEDSPTIDSASNEIPKVPEPNMEEQTRMHTIPAESEVLEELSTLDDIPFGDDLTPEEQQWVDEHYDEPADDPDESIWQHIENHVQALYDLKLNRLNGEFKSRLRKLMEGIAG